MGFITQNASSDGAADKHLTFQDHLPFHCPATAAPELGLCTKTCTWTW